MRSIGQAKRRLERVTRREDRIHQLEASAAGARSDAQDAELARLASAHGFISALPKGYGTLVGERGVKLSGGQRQRIAIARVMLKDAPILVLDEATSALDSEVEAAIQEQLYALMEGKTVIAIAHRLSTIAAMDRLIVMDQGRVQQAGRPTEVYRRPTNEFVARSQMDACDAFIGRMIGWAERQ